MKHTNNYIATDGYILFYCGVFSQWYPANFVLDGIEFMNAEMYMMWAKNRLFKGPLEDDILNAKHPAECKALGRKIPNFDADLWNSLAKTFVYMGNMAKFTSNPGLLKILMEEPGEFVECSPSDRIWGIGMGIEDPRCTRPEEWQGTNWLGQVLTEVRDDLGLIYYT
jgi:ribA/ribD-fused uncharacterized protein